MKYTELKNMTADELELKGQELRKELFNLRFRLATGEVENPMRIRAIRKDIARVLTAVTEKQRG
ncbi:MAG: 50S ribosomal protein L29 [Nitrospirota bacterium]